MEDKSQTIKYIRANVVKGSFKDELTTSNSSTTAQRMVTTSKITGYISLRYAPREPCPLVLRGTHL